MTISVYWASGSPYSWHVLLALECKRLEYVSHELDVTKLEHRTAQMFKLSPRGRLPVLVDGDYVCYESLAILAYLDRKYIKPVLFGRSAQELGTIMRIICEYQVYVEAHITRIISSILFQGTESFSEELNHSIRAVATEARNINNRLTQREWLVGERYTAADIIVFPGIKLLLRTLDRCKREELRTPLMPVETQFPAIAAWLTRMETLPGYHRSYPPHWRA